MGGCSEKAFCEAKPLERGVGNYVPRSDKKFIMILKIFSALDKCAPPSSLLTAHS
jgi:hypothetical protein